MGIKNKLIATSFQEDAVGRMQVFVWVCFTEHDCTCTESGEHPVKWCGSKVCELLRADHGLTLMEVSEELGISCGLFHCQVMLTKDLRTQQ